MRPPPLNLDARRPSARQHAGHAVVLSWPHQPRASQQSDRLRFGPSKSAQHFGVGESVVVNPGVDQWPVCLGLITGPVGGSEVGEYPRPANRHRNDVIDFHLGAHLDWQ